MSESTVGVLILVACATATALVMHRRETRYFRACVWAALAADVLFQIVAYLYVGYLDPFFLVALIFGFFAAFLVAVAVGIPFHIARKRVEPAN